MPRGRRGLVGSPPLASPPRAPQGSPTDPPASRTAPCPHAPTCPRERAHGPNNPQPPPTRTGQGRAVQRPEPPPTRPHGEAFSLHRPRRGRTAGSARREAGIQQDRKGGRPGGWTDATRCPSSTLAPVTAPEPSASPCVPSLRLALSLPLSWDPEGFLWRPGGSQPKPPLQSIDRSIDRASSQLSVTFWGKKDGVNGPGRCGPEAASPLLCTWPLRLRGEANGDICEGQGNATARPSASCAPSGRQGTAEPLQAAPSPPAVLAPLSGASKTGALGSRRTQHGLCSRLPVAAAPSPTW